MITSTKNDQVKAVIELKKKARARAMYKRLGYREADIVPCEFNGISEAACTFGEEIIIVKTYVVMI